VVKPSGAGVLALSSIKALTWPRWPAHTAVLHHADMLADERMAALVAETTRLIVGYLSG